MPQENVIDATARIIKSNLGTNIMIREFCTIHDSVIESGCKVYERTSIKKSQVSAESEINTGSYIENAVIGPGVQIAPNCVIVGVTHSFSQAGVQHEDIFVKIHIGANAWIGAGAIILPGVYIGEGAVIGAGAIVKNNVPAHFRYAGTPMDIRLEEIVD